MHQCVWYRSSGHWSHGMEPFATRHSNCSIINYF